MGVKRPFDEETFQELSFKLARQLDEDNKSIPIPHEASEKDAVPGYVDDMVHKAEFGEELLDDNLQTGATLPWMTSSSSEEEAGSDGAFYLPICPDFVDLNIPSRVPVHNEDSYSYLLNVASRKEVPVGPNHQADIPEWNPNIKKKESSCFEDTLATDHKLSVVGTPIFPMLNPNFSFIADANIGSGRSCCTCVDKDSIRCVHQHVEEAREKVKESLGEEKFAGLGFHYMGEELASAWTDEEEYVFHETIYSNPVSLGKDFWKSLSVAFPSRTNMEFVSYYFNVFILRRRAVQNRSDFLDIDSDDDEWQGDGRRPDVEANDDDFVVESLGNEDLHVGSEIGVSCNIDNDNYDDDDDGNGNGDVGTDRHDDTMNGNQEEQLSPKSMEKLEEDYEVINQVNNMAKVLSSNNNTHAGIYLERTSFPLIHGSCGELAGIQENGIKGEHIKFLGGKIHGMNESLGPGFILEGCDTKAWDYTFSSSRLKTIDLLPTCNMIEEIFGPCAWNN